MQDGGTEITMDEENIEKSAGEFDKSRSVRLLQVRKHERRPF